MLGNFLFCFSVVCLVVLANWLSSPGEVLQLDLSLDSYAFIQTKDDARQGGAGSHAAAGGLWKQAFGRTVVVIPDSGSTSALRVTAPSLPVYANYVPDIADTVPGVGDGIGTGSGSGSADYGLPDIPRQDNLAMLPSPSWPGPTSGNIRPPVRADRLPVLKFSQLSLDRNPPKGCGESPSAKLRFTITSNSRINNLSVVEVQPQGSKFGDYAKSMVEEAIPFAAFIGGEYRNVEVTLIITYSSNERAGAQSFATEGNGVELRVR